MRDGLFFSKRFAIIGTAKYSVPWMPIQCAYKFKVHYEQAALPLQCVKLPNPNLASACDPVSMYHPFFQDAMDESVKEAIRFARKGLPELNKDPVTGGYRIMEAKQKRAPYDDFLKYFTSNYGTDSRFPNGPRSFNGVLLSELKPMEEYIFGLVFFREKAESPSFSKNALEMFMLPRREILSCKDNKNVDVFYEGRHTHKEFLFGHKNQSLVGAGTLFVSHGEAFKTIGFNLRSGHFGCHKDTAENREKLMKLTAQLMHSKTSYPGQGFFIHRAEEQYFPAGSGLADIPVSNWEMTLPCKF